MKTNKSNPPRKLARVQGAISGQPWAITPEWLETICGIVSRHVNGDQISFEMPDVDEEEMHKEHEPYEIRNGVAIIPVCGPLFPHANMMTQLSGATSYDSIREAMRAAMLDEKVECLMFDIDSPGGSCLGLAELASEIYHSQQNEKSIFALANGQCCSAAYMLASQCDGVFCTEGSMVGSIGTILRIDSTDRAEKNQGVDSTIIRSGELKAAGEGPMTPSQEDSLRRMVGSYFEQFKSAVVRGRGSSVDIDTVSTGEVWIGSNAVENGLCDGVSTMDDLIEQYGS